MIYYKFGWNYFILITKFIYWWEINKKSYGKHVTPILKKSITFRSLLEYWGFFYPDKITATIHTFNLQTLISRGNFRPKNLAWISLHNIHYLLLKFGQNKASLCQSKLNKTYKCLQFDSISFHNMFIILFLELR